ncbi:MAG: nucleotide exchange factor GrpE [Nitrospinae bacterium]|nr:nucleotide exchange factor GrpE [Nitrospinota bacterium]
MKIPIVYGDDHPPGEGQEGKNPEGSSPSFDMPSAEPPAEVPIPSEVRVQELEAALAQKTREHATVHEQLLRLGAEFDNYRKRMARQFEDAKRFAGSDVVIGLLPGLDNLERALTAARQDVSPSGALIAQGVEMVLQQFKGALAHSGVQEVEARGKPFDPTRHEAVGVVPVSPGEDGTVVEEVQRGYLLHERVLRPARVVVGKADKEANRGGT